MREIKFRAWVKKGGAMADWETITKECDRFSLLKDQNFIFMQYTGLKDKNGTEIYEGDILNDKTIVMFGIVDIDDNEMLGSNQVCGFYRKTPSGEDYHMDFQDYDRVIGNIHENKELLDIQN